MVSNNNVMYRWEHDTQNVPHYGLRKLGVGVASVLLGTTFGLGFTAAAHADTVSDAQTAAPTVSTANVAQQSYQAPAADTQTAPVAQQQTAAEVQTPVTTQIPAQPATTQMQSISVPAENYAATNAALNPAQGQYQQAQDNSAALYGASLVQNDGSQQNGYQSFTPNTAQNNATQADAGQQIHRSWDMDVNYTFSDKDQQFSEGTFYGVPDKAGQQALPDSKLHIDVLADANGGNNDKITLTQSGTNVGKATYKFVKAYDGTDQAADPDNPTAEELQGANLKGHHYTVYEIVLPLQQQIDWRYVNPTDSFIGTLTVDHVNNGRDVTQTHLATSTAVFYQYGDHWKIHYHSDDGKIDQTVDGPFITTTNGQQKINYQIPEGYKLVNDDQVQSIGLEQAKDDPNYPAVVPMGGLGGYPTTTVHQNEGVIDVPLTLAAVKSSWTGQFVDKDNNNSPVGDPSVLNGNSGDTVTPKMSIPDNYELAPGATIPTSVTLTDDPANQQIPLVHKHKQYKPGDPGSDQYDLTKTITRTINVHNPATKKVDTTSQPANLTRTVDVDLVNGDKQYTDWTTGSWDAFTTPDVIGWTPDTKNVPAQNVTIKDKDATVDINYVQDASSWTGQFVDKDNGNKPVGNPVKITGKVGDTVNPKLTIPDGYELVPGTKVPTNVKLPEGGTTAQIPVQHKHHVVHPGDPDGGQYALTHDATRTIEFKGLDGVKNAPKSEIQKAQVTRTATVDDVTKQVISYSPWTKSAWKAYNAPEVDGYVANPTSIAEAPVDENTKDTTAVINYEKNGSWTGQFVDKDNNNSPVGDPVKITGDKGSSHDVKMGIPDNYELAPGATIPTNVTMDGTDQNVQIPLVHKHKTITGDDPEADKYGTRMTITRTIILHNPDKEDAKVTQPVTLKRTADMDLVTGKIVSYTDWSEGDWPEYAVPQIDHYKASPDKVNAQHVTHNDKDTTVEVIYTDETGTWTGHFVDDDANGATVGTPVEVKGDAGTTQKVNMPIPDGYELAQGQTIPDQVTLKQGAQTQGIHLVHKHELVRAGDPDAKKFNLQDLKKAVTRTIVFKGLDDKKDPVVQKVVLLRTADVDLVTKEAKYSDWSTDEWPSFDVPAVDGYTADKTSIDSAKVDGTTEDQIVVVNYTKNADSQAPASQAPAQPAETPAAQPAAPAATPAAPAAQVTPSAPAAVQTVAPVAAVSPVVASQPAAVKQAALPQTGNENMAAILGLGLASMSLGLGLLGKKRFN